MTGVVVIDYLAVGQSQLRLIVTKPGCRPIADGMCRCSWLFSRALRLPHLAQAAMPRTLAQNHEAGGFINGPLIFWADDVTISQQPLKATLTGKTAELVSGGGRLPLLYSAVPGCSG